MSDVVEKTPEKPKKKKKTVLWIILGIIGFIIVIAIISPGSGSSSSSSSTSSNEKKVAEKPTTNDYETKGLAFEYRKGVLKSYNIGDLIVVSGEVNQIFQDKNLFIFTKNDPYLGYIDDKVYVECDAKPEVIVGDIIKVYARYRGTQKFKTVLNAETEVPLFQKDYIGIIKQK